MFQIKKTEYFSKWHDKLKDDHPRFDTVMRVLKAMGLKLVIKPCVAEKRAKYSAK